MTASYLAPRRDSFCKSSFVSRKIDCCIEITISLFVSLYKDRENEKGIIIFIQTSMRCIRCASVQSNNSKMKFAATIVLLAIGAACISAQHATVWGDVKNTSFMGQEAVTVTSSWLQVIERTIEYHSVSADSNGISLKTIFSFDFYKFQFGSTIIRGIMHLDHKTKSRVKPSIARGGVGHKFAILKIVSERSHGIKSSVRFYS